uniref:Vitamin K-dependent protein C n=1 Tax=Periophthalmus magnuspinnatus TaxID=409849 RepID=A0A3B4A501_9GOBI
MDQADSGFIGQYNLPTLLTCLSPVHGPVPRLLSCSNRSTPNLSSPRLDLCSSTGHRFPSRDLLASSEPCLDRGSSAGHRFLSRDLLVSSAPCLDRGSSAGHRFPSRDLLVSSAPCLDRRSSAGHCSPSRDRLVSSAPSPGQLQLRWTSFSVQGPLRVLCPLSGTLAAPLDSAFPGDPCDSAPCQNGATCTRHVHSFTCKCAPALGFSTSWSCRHRNGGCEHFCADSTERAQICSCADGYRRDQDNTSCIPNVAFPCGRIQMYFAPRVVNGQVCPKGHCPWQVTTRLSVLVQTWFRPGLDLVPNLVSVSGEHDLSLPENTEQKRRVVKVLVHEDYNQTSSDSDLALLKLVRDVKLGRYVIPVCLPGPRGQGSGPGSGLARTLAAVRVSTVSGWGRVAQFGQPSDILQRVNVPRVRTLDCRAQTGLNISRNMLCFGMRSGGQDSCEGDSGGPLVTRFRKTSFLTGIVSWGRGCAERGQYGVYTRVINYLPWIYRTMETGPRPGLRPYQDQTRTEAGPGLKWVE